MDIEKLRKTYETDVDLMSTKSRFGFFSLPPSHTAAKTDFSSTTCRQSEDGKVLTESRNIYTGPTASGVLKKSYFSVPESIYKGDPYPHPQIQKEDNVTIDQRRCHAAYPYMCENPQPKDPKQYREEDGSVVTKPKNICANPISKIDYERDKNYKYIHSPYDAEKRQKNKQRVESAKLNQKQNPFKAGTYGGRCFTSNYKTYYDCDIKKAERGKSAPRKITHQNAFKPSGKMRRNVFSYPQHQSDYPPNKQKQLKFKKGQIFKPAMKPESSKFSPSISCSFMNLRSKIK